MRNMYQAIFSFLKSIFKFYLKLSPAGKNQHLKDRSGLPDYDPGIDMGNKGAIAWICHAQDSSKSQDGGVAYIYSLIDGWGDSYAETTGYIVPTILAYAKSESSEKLPQRAEMMLDWLVSIQLKEGGFRGGQANSKQKAPVTFNTGQILLGLAAGVREFGDKYLEPMCRAADWLVKTQDSDGCWRAYPSKYAVSGEKAYDTHVAWALLEAAKTKHNTEYIDAALKNVHWAMSLQKENGWFAKCCVIDPKQPLTHTLGYVFRGLVEAYLFQDEPDILDSCKRLSDGLLKAIRSDGFLPGRLLPNWKASVSWACLTGTVQIAYCWLKMYQITGDTEYRDAAFAANKYVRQTMKLDGPPETRGAIGGSFPIYGGYCQYAYPNWACKFFIDSNMLEQQVRGGG